MSNTPENVVAIERALLSVSDKNGLLELARYLAQRQVEILSTGGTAKLLIENGIPVQEVSDYTGFPEMMDGRLKTLHPKIHGGILGRRRIDDEAMENEQIGRIDLVVVNLYPFQQTIARPDCDLAMAIENIDIGGPTMLRAAAKNHADVTVVVDSADYASVIAEMDSHGGTTLATRFNLACKVFDHTALYDGAISSYLSRDFDAENTDTTSFPATLNLQFRKVANMRYGENPHQNASFYADSHEASSGIAAATLLQGKAMSFNNVADADAAWECVQLFEHPACVIVKHANPCGVAEAGTLSEAYDLAFQTDPVSAFGGIIACNRPLDADTAKTVIERQFVEVIIAPGIDDDALAVVATKKNVRLLDGASISHSISYADYKRVSGGLLVQEHDFGLVPDADMKVVTERQPSDAQWLDLKFAWKVVKIVKSNAIIYVRDRQTIGIGAGQMSRVYSARIAGIKAADENLQVQGSVMASDAFFPFRDGIDAAHDAGIEAVIQPGGSMRDSEIITAANEHNIAMVFTGMRHFRH